MAHKIIWSPIVIEDLEEIAGFISRDSESYAASVIQKIVEAVETCGLFPLMGREVPELEDPNIREVIVYKYRLSTALKPKRLKSARSSTARENSNHRCGVVRRSEPSHFRYGLTASSRI
jgi:plasmid stabilization system protein ParE